MKSSKSKSRKSVCRLSDVVCPSNVSRPGGVIMPHVVSPEVAGGDVHVPPLVPESQLMDVETVPLAEDQADAGAKKS